MSRLACVLSLTLTGLLLVAGPAAAEEPPKPDPDRVRHAEPDRYRALTPELGDAKAIQGLAAQLVKKDAGDTLRSIWIWIQRNLQLRRVKGSDWRSVSEMIRVGSRQSPVEAAIALGTLARAAGIATTWIKTLDIEWLERGAENPPIRGRVFLEVHVDGAWRLLDPEEMLLYERYDPKARILPGKQLVFDKGGDPFALVLPNRQRLYSAQVNRFVASFDVRRLPWTAPRDLLAPIKVFVAGRAPVSRYVTATCDTMGYLVAETFTARDFRRVWPRAKGKILIVTASSAGPEIPAPLRKDVLPDGAEALKPDAKSPAFLARTLTDGTRVIYVAAQDYAGVEVAVARALSELRR